METVNQTEDTATTHEYREQRHPAVMTTEQQDSEERETLHQQVEQARDGSRSEGRVRQ
jgi:hypothetical protein